MEAGFELRPDSIQVMPPLWGKEVDVSPVATEPVGYIVVIGSASPTKHGDVFVAFAPTGQVDAVVQCAQDATPEHVDLLDFAPCTFSEFKVHAKWLERDRVSGHRYSRGERFEALCEMLWASCPCCGRA